MSCTCGLRRMLGLTVTRSMTVLLLVLVALSAIVLGTNNDGSLPGNTMTKRDDPNQSDSTSSTSAALTANETGPLLSSSDQQQSPDSDSADWQHCSGNITRPCEQLGGYCLKCDFNESCIAGTMQSATCTVPDKVNCTGSRTFTRQYHCRYCYQMDHWLYSCKVSTNCRVNGARRSWPGRTTYRTECEVKEDHLCMGYRRFYRQVPCNWSSGYKWSTALILSITLGGFGVDRFYLGLWREGIGKLFSFGGLGVWTLVDVILIAVGYIGPSDGSLYI